MDPTQQIILGLAGVVMLCQAFRGWRMGPIRQLVRLGALAAAYAAGFFCAPALVPLLRPLQLPDFVLRAFAGMILWLLIYLLINLLGRLVFRKTNQNSGLAWFIYGIAGALLGMAFGLVLVVVAAIAIRFMGAMVEGSTSDITAQESPVARGVLWLKRSLETGVIGEFLQAVDPVPKGYYETTAKIGRLISRPDAIKRFAEYPGAQEFIQSPEIAALREDPEIAREIAAHHYLELLRNERMRKVFNDPKTAKLLKNFDAGKALDFALKD